MEMWDKNGNRLRRRTAALMVALLLCLSLGSVGVQALGGIPDRLSLTAGSRAMLNPGLPVSAELQGESVALRRLEGGLELSAGRECGSASLILRLLGILPVKTVDVEVSSARTLIPGGSSVGIAIETRGLVVVGMSDLGSTASPARRAGLKSGDIITQVDGTEVNDPAAMSALLRGGRQARLTVNRGGAVQTLALTPAVDPRDGRPRIGAWVRSGTAGVGTLTYVDPETGDFGGLGHAIADVDTGVIMPVGEGALYENEIVQINRGEKGRPGEIVGDFFTEAHQIGVITDNGALGVFGSDYSGDLDALLSDVHRVQLIPAKEVSDEEFSVFNPLRLQRQGRLCMLTLRGDRQELEGMLNALQPLFMEFLPLSLEEVFILEMEDRGYAQQ